MPAHGAGLRPIAGAAALPDLAAAARAGVRGVVCVWRGCSADNAKNQTCRSTCRSPAARLCGWMARPATGCTRLRANGARVALTLERRSSRMPRPES